MLDYKNKLVTERYLSYQKELINTIFSRPSVDLVPRPISVEEYYTYIKTTHRLYCFYGCHNSAMSYEKYLGKNTASSNHITSNAYIDKLTNSNLYFTYSKCKQHKISESLWFNVELSHDLVSISGEYELTRKINKFYYIPKNKLFLNNIPVQFITMSPKNLNNSYKICMELKFAFDLKQYCLMIDFILNAYKYKNTLFMYLPKELINIILHLTSIV